MITFTQGFAIILIIAATLFTAFGFHLGRKLKVTRQENSEVGKSFLLLWIMLMLFWLRTVVFAITEFVQPHHRALEITLTVLTVLLAFLAGVCLVRMLRVMKRANKAEKAVE